MQSSTLLPHVLKTLKATYSQVYSLQILRKYSSQLVMKFSNKTESLQNSRSLHFRSFSSFVKDSNFFPFKAKIRTCVKMTLKYPRGQQLAHYYSYCMSMDMPNSVRTSPQIFADDSCVITNHPNLSILQNDLNLEVSRLFDRYNANKLYLY